MVGRLRLFGNAGEDRAVRFLKKKGFKILEINWRCSYGEIDIVAEDKKTIVIIEVKTRREVGTGLPLEAVDRRKQRKLVQLAEAYASEKGLMGRDLRIDCVGIQQSNLDGELEIIHVIGAVESIS